MDINDAAGPAEAPAKKKRQRVRKSTRDRRRREMEAWEAANNWTPSPVPEETEAAGSGDEAAVENKGDVADTMKLKVKDVEPSAAEEEASRAASTTIPATGSGSPTTMLLSKHDEIVKQLRENHRNEIDGYFNDLVNAKSQAALAHEASAEKDIKIKKLLNDIEQFEQDIADPVRGYDAQIKDAAATIQQLEAEVKRERERAEQAESSRDLLEQIKSKAFDRCKQLEKEVKSRDAEIESLERQHSDFDQTIQSFGRTDAEVDELKAELERYQQYDNKLGSQLDSWLQGLVHTDDAFEKIEALGKSLQEARDAAETARHVAQEEVEKKRSSQQQVLTFSDITSIAQQPVYPASVYTSTSTQTLFETPTRTFTGASGQTSIGRGYSNTSTQTIVDKPVVAFASTATQTSVEPSATYAIAGTQTAVQQPVYHQFETQTLSQTAYSQAGIQTDPTKMRSASTQTLTDSSPPLAPPERAGKAGRVARRNRIHVPANKAPAIPEIRSSSTQTLPTKAAQPAPPEVTLWSLYSTSDVLLWLVFFLLIFFALPGGLSVFSTSKSASSYDLTSPSHLTADDYDAKFFTEDLAKVGFERWLGVDTSWLA